MAAHRRRRDRHRARGRHLGALAHAEPLAAAVRVAAAARALLLLRRAAVLPRLVRAAASACAAVVAAGARRVVLLLGLRRRGLPRGVEELLVQLVQRKRQPLLRVLLRRGSRGPRAAAARGRNRVGREDGGAARRAAAPPGARAESAKRALKVGCRLEVRHVARGGRGGRLCDCVVEAAKRERHAACVGEGRGGPGEGSLEPRRARVDP